RRPRDGVLYVGRIEPRKNQLALIRALNGTDIPLRLIGSPGRFNRAYYDECRRCAEPNVTFVSQCTPAALRDEYRAAKVHACVSWYETPGLASLEAAACGCAVVVTPGGCTREYFGDDAAYCMPGDPTSIHHTVEHALQSPIPPTLAARVSRDCTWKAAASKTLAAYNQAVSM
ncbi:MAG: glycosyltransferase family 4 protein, partial [Phycisphaerae bacterium]|nr:glycosyltransferase family 4 protein [Phycisphaerae bacterium]